MEVKRVRTQQPKKNLWKPEEDLILKNYVEAHGEGNWATVSERSGLKRGGKSCRLRWKNYLRPNIKRGEMSKEEEDLIIRMHKLLGNRWSLIAGRLPGRTDNEVKNYWNTHLNKKCLLGKRKAIDSSHHHHEDKEENINKKNKLCEAEANGSPNMTISPSPTKQCLDGRKVEEKEEESTITSSPWKDERNSFNCSSTDMEYPIMGGDNNAAFMFDDEPLIAYLDSFVLFEAFGWEGEEAYAEMQSVIETRVSSTDRTHVTKENLHTLW